MVEEKQNSFILKNIEHAKKFKEKSAILQLESKVHRDAFIEQQQFNKHLIDQEAYKKKVFLLYKWDIIRQKKLEEQQEENERRRLIKIMYWWQIHSNARILF